MKVYGITYTMELTHLHNGTTTFEQREYVYPEEKVSDFILAWRMFSDKWYIKNVKCWKGDLIEIDPEKIINSLQ